MSGAGASVPKPPCPAIDDVTPWLFRRTLDAALSATGGILLLVALVHLLPGDPLAAVLRDHPADPATVAALRERWGTDLSLGQTMVRFVGGALRGDLGISLSAGLPVTTLLAERLGPTLLLGGLTLLINFTVGLALGLWSALRPATLRAHLLGGLTMAGYALPSFVLGLILVWVFALQLGWLPPAGYSDPLLAPDAGLGAHLLDRLRHLALPLATMVLATIAVPIRHQRAAVAETLDAPWVLAARARGVAPARLAWHHIWRPALTPIVTLLGLWLPALVAGAVFVEAVFAWPGLGTLIADATANRDVPVVIGAGAVLIIAVQCGSLIADLLYRLVDPAQRRS
ncbi:MAG: ABC transporter permease [Gemmatimonadales bacterium]|nr:ABC transporter permease [Gemmatimonadales bacterium]MDZ4389155.1 ABC transporter permease [Gemmatimonadales bacterium]